VGTPIGNLEDITLRALRVLRSADAVLAEDTRHTGRLLARYGMKKKLVSYHAHNERARRDSLVERIQSGAALALVSDAGTPAVADPGADLALAVANAGLKVVPIPGPCAPASAVVAAGALTPNEESFSFIGFLPPKTTARRKRWRKFSNAPGSVVAFVPPHKLVAVLEDAAVELGERRQCVVCREMTKVRARRLTVFFSRHSFPKEKTPSRKRVFVFVFVFVREAVIIPLTKLLLPSVSFRPSPVRATPGAVTTQLTTKV
jgi:16S rRNA (cytidine1402-2'-O)-methyltransferase